MCQSPLVTLKGSVRASPASSKHAVGTLLSERERWIVGRGGLSISNRRVAEKFKSQQDQGESS